MRHCNFLITLILFLITIQTAYTASSEINDNIVILYEKNKMLQGYPTKSDPSRFVTLHNLIYALERGQWDSAKKTVSINNSENILTLIAKSGEDNIYTYFFNKSIVKGRKQLILFKITERSSYASNGQYTPDDSRFNSIVGDVFGRASKYANEKSGAKSNSKSIEGVSSSTLDNIKYAAIFIFVLIGIIAALRNLGKKKCPKCSDTKIKETNSVLVSQRYEHETKSGEADKRYKENPLRKTLELTMNCQKCGEIWQETVTRKD